MKKENRQLIKQKRCEKRRQVSNFKELTKNLFDKKFVTSNRYEESLIGEDGKAHINVDLTKIESPFSIFSYEKRLDPEIYSYIEDQVFYIRSEVPVIINFDDGGNYSDDLKNKISKCVKRHYLLDYEDKRISHRKSLLFGVFELIIGIIFLGLYISLNAIKTSDILYLEILCILSWVFIWQSVDQFFISGHYRRIDILNAAQLALVEITFNKN